MKINEIKKKFVHRVKNSSTWLTNFSYLNSVHFPNKYNNNNLNRTEQNRDEPFANYMAENFIISMREKSAHKWCLSSNRFEIRMNDEE